MGTLSLRSKREEQTPAAPAVPAAEGAAAPVFDPESHYVEMAGVSRVRFWQGAHYFGPTQLYVGPAHAELAEPERPAAPSARDTARAEALARAQAVLAAGPRLPDTLAAAERENARARAVEDAAA